MATSLRETCRRAIAEADGWRVPLPDIPAMRPAERKLILPEDAPPEGVDLDLVAAQILQTLERHEPLSKRQIGFVPWCFWSTTPCIAEKRSFAQEALLQLKHLGSSRPVNRLANGYLADFASDRPMLAEVAALLERETATKSKRWLSLQRDFSVFDPKSGPVKLAQAAIGRRCPVRDILKSFGLHDTSAEGGFAFAATTQALLSLSRQNDQNHLDRLKLVTSLALDESGRTLMQGLANPLAEALLRPMVNSHVDQDTSDQFVRVITVALGDPRLERNGRWVSVESDLRNLVVRWLSRLSLRQFLDVVDQTAQVSKWFERRRFWEGHYEFYESKKIEIEAWVAFGESGARLARRAFGNSAGFARLHSQRKYVSSGHAVLLLKIGELMVADWSDNGKCNIWSRAADQDAPELYRSNYGSNEVQAFFGQGNFETADKLAWAHQGNWQDRIAQRLYELTGIRVPSKVYR